MKQQILIAGGRTKAKSLALSAVLESHHEP